MKKFSAALFCLAFVLSGSKQLCAQSYVYATGNPTFSTQIPIENGFINVNNGEIHIEIPLAQNTQRGKEQLNERLVYDSRIWKIVSNGNYVWEPTNVPNSMGGWQLSAGFTDPPTYSSYYSEYGSCGEGQETLPTQEYFGSFAWTDPQGTNHKFGTGFYQSLPLQPCAPNQTPSSGSGYTLDGSGYYMTMTYDPSFDGVDTVVYDKQGNQVYPLLQDPNGNYMTSDSSGNLVDTLGRTPLETSTSGNKITYSVLTYGGTRVNYVITTETINYNTNFGQEAVGEGIGSFTAIQSIQLPDGSMYSFGYDSGTTAGNYGELTSITLPSGGTIQYTYSNFLDSFQNQNRWLHTRVKDGGTTTFTPSTISNCSSSSGCQEKTTITSPTGNDTIYTFTLDSGNNGNASSWNTGIAAYQGSASGGTELKSTSTSYTYNTVNLLNSAGESIPYLVPQSQTVLTSLPDAGVTSKVVMTLDGIGANPTNIKQWDYYSGTAPSSPTEQITYTYNNGLISYVNGASVPTQVITADGNGNPVSETVYSYDQTTPTPTSGLPSHNSVSGNRGNLTAISQWINSSGATLNQTSTYDDAGTLLSSIDPNGTTTYGHDSTDTFVTLTTPTTPSSGVSLPTSSQYDASTGLINNSTDPNGTQTVYKSYDAFGRAGEIDHLDSGGNTIGKTVYTYSSPTLFYVNPYQSGSQNGSTATQLDGYGRVSRVAVYNGQSGNDWYQQDTCYDANGNANFQTYSYQGTGFDQSKVCAGSGDSYTYDALGRIKTLTHADGTAVGYTYTGRATQVVDENGATRISQVDGLGRTTILCEVSAKTLQVGTSTSPVSCGTDITGTGFPTNYAYTLSTHTTTVTQGAQTRTFQTDWLGRTVLTQEPERGKTTYSYTYNNTGLVMTRQKPTANQTSTTTLTTTTTQYDSMGRVTGVTYSDGITPAKNFYYDNNPYASWASETTTNLKGHLSIASTSNPGNLLTSSLYSYDALGRVTTMWQCAPSICGTANQASRPALTFAYNWTGNLTSEFDGASGSISYGRSPAGEVTSITNLSYQGAQNPANLVSNVLNGPNGPISYSLGNGLSQYNYYDSLGRLQGGWVCIGAPSAACNAQRYGDVATWSGARVASLSDDAMGQGILFGYDDFNRLTSTNIGNGTQTFQYVYDRSGNRWQQNAPQGGNSFSVAFNESTNQINSGGYAYDAAGNMTNDGSHSYVYDAEGNIVSVDSGGTAQYAYDAMNHRVRTQTASGTNEYLYDYAGRRTSTWIASNNFGSEGRIYWGAQQIAFRAFDGTTYFDHQDYLGTERIRTDYTGATVDVYRSLPWGDGYSPQINGTEPDSDQDNLHFAGLDQDAETTTEHAQFRQYSPAQGHWMSPDPYSGSYDFSDPQSFNRYAYVTNNPLSFADPTGQDGDNPLSGTSGPLSCTAAAGSEGGDLPADAFCINELINVLESLFSGPSFHGSLQPRPNSQPWDEYHIHYGPNIAGALGLPDAGCEFGSCGGGPQAFGPSGPSQGPNPISATSGALSGGIILPFFYGLVGPAFSVSYDPKNHLLCGGVGVGVSAGHTAGGGPVVVHAKPGNTSKDVLGGWSLSGGYNWTPWWGYQGSVNGSGYTAGYSFGVPGASGSITYSWCRQGGG
jgi:RHS repeat-associated protein